MNTQEYIGLVYKNLKGDLSKAEFDELNRLTAQDSNLSEIRLDIEDAWDVSGNSPTITTKEETTELFGRITKKKQGTNTISSPSKTKVFSLRTMISGLAAVLVLALGVTWLMRGDIMTTYTEPGTYTLADNSTVVLRAGSQLDVPTFKDNARTVKLSGEAYFDITSDPNRPFTVASNNVNIEVLGTQFLVKNINDQTLIDLKEGKIKTIDLRSNNTEILTTGMKARHTSDGNIDIIEKYNNLYSWKNGTYQYKNVKLGDVLEELGLIHNTTILTTDPVLYDCVLNGILVGNNITDVLSRIAQKFNMDIKQNGSKWTLAGGKCN